MTRRSSTRGPQPVSVARRATTTPSKTCSSRPTGRSGFKSHRWRPARSIECRRSQYSQHSSPPAHSASPVMRSMSLLSRRCRKSRCCHQTCSPIRRSPTHRLAKPRPRLRQADVRALDARVDLDRVSDGHAPPLADRGALWMASAHAGHTALEAIEKLYTEAGSTAVYRRGAIDRCVRDARPLCNTCASNA